MDETAGDAAAVSPARGERVRRAGLSMFVSGKPFLTRLGERAVAVEEGLQYEGNELGDGFGLAVGGTVEGRVIPERMVEVSAHRDGDLRRCAVGELSEFQIGHDRSFQP